MLKPFGLGAARLGLTRDGLPLNEFSGTLVLIGVKVLAVGRSPTLVVGEPEIVPVVAFIEVIF